MEITFRLLAERPEFCPLLAEWYEAEWPELFRPGATALDEAASCLSADAPDCTVVMLENGEPVGAASLLREDVLPLPECSPWLGTVVVRPSHRGKGLGRAVVEEAVRRARSFGIRTLHLWTPRHRAFYERFGWTFVRDFSLRGKNVAILRISLRENPANPANPV